MARSRSSYFEAGKPRVEVVPMIDIMMFLLVFFVIITLKMIEGSGVPMELPSAATTREIKTATVTIGVTREGSTVLEGKTVTPGEPKGRLVALKAVEPLNVVLAGDKEVSLQTLLGVMDTVRSAGITTVGIAAKAERR
jgi:biopolymer transport protein ExbD